MGLKAISRLASGAIDRLNATHWPGNVRELENTVERAMTLCRGEPPRFSDLQPHLSEEKDRFAGTLDHVQLFIILAISSR